MIEKMENFIYKHTEKHYKVKKLQEGYSNHRYVVWLRLAFGRKPCICKG